MDRDTNADNPNQRSQYANDESTASLQTPAKGGKDEDPTCHPVDEIEIEIVALRALHSSVLISDGSPVHEIIIHNRGDKELLDITLELSCEGFVPPTSLEVPRIPGKRRVAVTTHQLDLALKYQWPLLKEISEQDSRRLLARVLDSTGAAIAEQYHDWVLCPLDVWMGATTHPELLSAFVTPNDPHVTKIASAVVEKLSQTGKEPSLEGYQRESPNRVYELVEAVYQTIQDCAFTYANPPASYENDGQRIRLAKRIVEDGRATCLDITLLGASVLEQIGLFPILILTKEHASLGIWLKDETFADALVYEPQRILKRFKLNEILLFDPTCATHRPSLNFQGARTVAEKSMLNDRDFVLAVDVVRARRVNVRPLPTTAEELGSSRASIRQAVAHTDADPRDLDHQLQVQESAQKVQRSKSETPRTRLDRWMQQLLDLSMRNRLLNAGAKRKAKLTFLRHDLDQIESELLAGKNLKVIAPPEELGKDEKSESDETLRKLLVEDLKSGKLRCNLERDAIVQKLKLLYRNAKRDLDESGTQNLYLAAGFLHYRQATGSREFRRAPLVLFPIELKRTGTSRGYTLSLSGEEPRANITLIEYLKRDYDIDIGHIDPLPEDESTSSVELVLRIIREKVKHETEWEVLEESELGEFSFSKYLLWKDLRDRTDVLTRSPLVKHLLERPHDDYPDQGNFISEADLDAKYSANKVLCPLSYDSSQLSAIVAASEGSTMVIEGPPGTGKSQTIANLIANAIGSGKSVLFVSEKMTALDVVYVRLKQLGLGTACLELHSKKANKKAILSQFKETLDEPRRQARGGGDAWKTITSNVDKDRERLNSHVQALHRTRVSGESVYRVVGQTVTASEDEACATEYDFGVKNAYQADEATRDAWRNVCKEMDARSEENNLGPSHPLLMVGISQYTPIREESSLRLLKKFPEVSEAFLKTGQALNELLFPSLVISAKLGWSTASKLCKHLSDGPKLGASSLLWLEDPEMLQKWTEVLDQLDEMHSIDAEFDTDFRESPRELDLKNLEELRREMDGGSFLVPWLRKRKIVAQFKGIAKNPKTIDIEKSLATLEKAKLHAKLATHVDAHFPDLQTSLGRAIEPSPDGSKKARVRIQYASSVISMRDLLVASCKWSPNLVNERLSEILSKSRDKTEFELAANALDTAYQAFARSKDELIAETEPLERTPLGWSLEETRALTELVQKWQSDWGDLLHWCAWQKARASAIDLGLRSVVDQLEAGHLVPGDAERSFDRYFAKLWLKHSISDDAMLQSFRGSQHSEQVQEFSTLDGERLELAKDELNRRVLKKRPTNAKIQKASAEGVRPKTALGLLHREIVKKTQHKAIRKLLGELGQEALALKPCFLMSPISVAQHVSPDFPLFDLVVFDEASQIPVWDAIGAIARGKQSIIVGDPKQLPPTSFFSKSAATDDSEEIVEDLESILDECLGARVPCHRLRWHYRSKHESLIEFSNQRYYDGNLFTFPSNTSDAAGVGFQYVSDGVYISGEKNTNPNEAKALVQEIVRRLKAPEENSTSIGVVTFNKAQAELIQDLLEDEVASNPEIAQYLNDSRDDAVFVKNLESVQGDERDVIFFSTCYGRDENGKFAMRFGPVGQSGGERRLNVAVTRAKRELLVFSSITYQDIDTNRTKAQGSRDLRSFLQYAQNAQEQKEADPASVSTGSDALVHSVAERLRERGWQVHEQVGSSDVRIDLAVLNPDARGEYIACIQIDGLNYAALATARDRDVLRASVLESMGWTIVPLWSIDWWRDPSKELDRIHERLGDILQELACSE